MKKYKVYLAAPIFTEAVQDYNEKILKKIEQFFPELDIYAPQRNKDINDKTKCASAEDIAVGDFDNNLDKTDIVIAVLDGDTPGIGTSVEIGYYSAACRNYLEQGAPYKRIIALYTDTRECSHTVNSEKIEKLNEIAECQFSYLNLLLVGAVKRYGVICRNIDEVITKLDSLIAELDEWYGVD